jgi:hypothetical protein
VTVALGRAGVGGLVGSLFRVQYLVSTLEENASPPCSSSCLPLRIQKWFDPQSNMIQCCVVRGLPPLGRTTYGDAGAYSLVRQHRCPDGRPCRRNRPATDRAGDARRLKGTPRRAAGDPRSRRAYLHPTLRRLLRVNRRLRAGAPSMDLARSLIEHVAAAPGSVFGELGEGYLRLSLASSREDLLVGASRLVRFVHLQGEARK